ncbi:Methyltransferase-like protein 6 [Fukomys damarensis]|uniref:Methyltransferase-like protein 6 n=1 Tax=Fukomys damarensis TaxID=885580 RepID=A0A091D2L2_FUKDA|nr:Methyltransferase-like protein 6 [Fukomys damarensis]
MASLQRKGLQARILTSEEKEKLKSDQALVSDFKQQKLEQEAQKNWDLFYKRNSINFFKNRHWTTREFEELKSSREFEGQKLTILEAGCGVGNCLFPLLEEDFNIFAYACDFSPRAVEYVKQNPLYDTERCKVFQCDLTKDDLLDNVPQESVDIVMLIFVLSAIHPDKMHLVLQNIYKVCGISLNTLHRVPTLGSLWLGVRRRREECEQKLGGVYHLETHKSLDRTSRMMLHNPRPSWNEPTEKKWKERSTCPDLEASIRPAPLLLSSAR